MLLYLMWSTNKTIKNDRMKNFKQKLNKIWILSFQCNESQIIPKYNQTLNMEKL